MEKLVRDKIPEIIKNEYGYVDFYKANKKELRKFLFEKLLEETDEVYEAKNKKELIEELADTFEVIYTILENEDISLEEIEQIRKQKLEERWWFKEWFILRKDN